MDNDTLKAFVIGFALGSVLSGWLGYSYGRRISKAAVGPEFRVVVATVIVTIWAIAQVVSLVFATQVDGWLNAIMGMVAGFFFGDGLVESVRGKKN